VIWQYDGMAAEEMERRIVFYSERAMTTTVNDIEHMESQSMFGVGVIKVFFHPRANIAAAGIKAIKFRDPDGHNLELLWFPEGKGNPVWHEPTKDLFLGIDHTAMTVRSTESSIKFYRDLLGMTVAGGTLNMGAEQEHLDSLPGARARVTGMAPTIDPSGVEFLEYELPIAGRPFPIDSHPTDLWHWQTTLVVPDVEAAAAQVHGMGQMISPGVVTFPDRLLGFGKGFLVRDPDGHVMQLVSQ
jgi:catechol 2,3-dioxygenase-like lactoylglutathione lyase family enzyme